MEANNEEGADENGEEDHADGEEPAEGDEIVEDENGSPQDDKSKKKKRERKNKDKSKEKGAKVYKPKDG
jgi:hypothetical protein